jgi:pimeloyl-ACP methyl ester carboxylesterase
MHYARYVGRIVFVILCGTLVPPAPGQEPGPGGSYLKVDGGRLYYEVGGTGTAIVLLHDGLVHSVAWDAAWKPLCRQFHVVRYDRRGYGRSDPPRAQFSPTADLAALLKHVHVPRATLVGCSSGAGLAIDFALEHPGRVEQLILIGPVLHGMATSGHFYERGEKNNAPLKTGDVKAAADNWSNDRYQLAAGHDAARKALYDALVQSPHNLRYSGQFEIRPSPPAIDRLTEVRVPTLILVGESDIADVHAYSGAIEAGVWGARREVVKDAGHLLGLDQPERLNRIITRFTEKYRTISVPAERLQACAGRYRLPDGVRHFVVKDGRLALRAPGERDEALFPASESRFFSLAGGLAEFEFLSDAKGQVTAVQWKEGDAVRRGERVSNGR